MDIRPIIQTKTILCYGDSNTWGYVPMAEHAGPKKRYPRSVRWPGLLQILLGEQFYVVEEGLNSRTTNLDYSQPPERNGKTYLPPCLYSHAPLDLVVLSLGGNDTKTYFNRSANEIAHGLGELIDLIQLSEYGPDMQSAPQVLVTSPVIPLAFTEKYVDEAGVPFMVGGVNKAREMVQAFAQLANQKNCGYINLSDKVLPSNIDGVHYDEAAHSLCAHLLASKIKEILT